METLFTGIVSYNLQYMMLQVHDVNVKTAI